MVDLPPGFCFRPSDELLVVYYLRRYISGEPLPGGFITAADVYRTEPWNLVVDGKDEAYFFSRRTRLGAQSKRPSRTAGEGSWFSFKKDTRITSSVDGKGEVAVGIKHHLSFNHHGKKHTGWIMYEYVLCSREFQKLVLCRIKRSDHNLGEAKRALASCSCSSAAAAAAAAASLSYSCSDCYDPAALMPEPKKMRAPTSNLQERSMKISTEPSSTLAEVPPQEPYADQRHDESLQGTAEQEVTTFCCTQEDEFSTYHQEQQQQQIEDEEDDDDGIASELPLASSCCGPEEAAALPPCCQSEDSSAQIFDQDPQLQGGNTPTLAAASDDQTATTDLLPIEQQLVLQQEEQLLPPLAKYSITTMTELLTCDYGVVEGFQAYSEQDRLSSLEQGNMSNDTISHGASACAQQHPSDSDP